MGVPFTLVLVALVTEPRLVALRLALEAERADGAAFSEAWPRGRVEALDGLTGWHREQWASVLLSTRWAWRSAYYGGASSRVDLALSELASYAADAEAEPLRYELPVAGA